MEIFINIRLYLGTNVLPIRLVIATALMAIARKVIILDISTISAEEMLAIAAIGYLFSAIMVVSLWWGAE